MSATEGVPAFPMSVGIGPAGDVLTSDDFKGGAGMTLRDYFAAKAMQGFASTLAGVLEPRFGDMAKDAYVLADAMLKARKA